MPVKYDRLAGDVGVTRAKLHVFSCYGDIPASMRARRTAAAIARLAGKHWRTTSEMWKIDSLQVSAPIREMISSDAVNADVVVVSVSSLTQSEPALTEWLNAMNARKRGCLFAGLVVGLPGDGETSVMELGCMVESLTRFARMTGRDFIWHRMETSVMDDGEWLANGVNDLLSRKLWFEVFGSAFRKLATRCTIAPFELARHNRAA